MNFGIESMEIYIPNTYVGQSDLEKHYKVGEGKYTKGLGQQELSFTYPFQDINSLALTAVNNLLQKHKINPAQIGRLEVGTETLPDKSKSTKTVLMSLFKGFHDIEGVTSLNACYGATNALINTLNWMSSPSWDGRYGIVVASDVAVYEDGPARPTGGAGAVAMLISNKPKISFSPIRATYIEDVYDFYKPIPSSEYPVVDGKFSIECYLKAVKECYLKLKEKTKDQNIIDKTDYFCFHSPYAKMVQKAFHSLLKVQHPSIPEEEINKRFANQVEPSLYVSQRVGNIYAGSLYLCLYSLLYKNPKIADKKVMLFSYGSGLCATMFEVYIHSNPLSADQIQQTTIFFNNRIKVDASTFTTLMLEKENNFGKWRGKLNVNQSILVDNAFYLEEIDDKWRRHYAKKSSFVKLIKKNISDNNRIENLLDTKIPTTDVTKFYKLSIEDRRKTLNQIIGNKINEDVLQSGGITTFCADKMIENVIGKLSMPLGVVPMILINHKKYAIPMCIEEPSVVAATSSIGKFISPYSFITSSSPSIMIGQVHLPSIEASEMHLIEKVKHQLIDRLNQDCPTMVKRNGGVKQIRLRHLEGNDYSLDIMIDVRDAMGANLINTLSEKAKELVSKMGVKTGISILSNYCVERRAISSFTIPVEHMSWKGHSGLEVAQKIIEAYQFATKDTYRAVTHNKGVMNGIDALCMAAGQDWRAIESAAHAYAARSGKYQPLSHYRIFEKDKVKYFEGKIQLPIAVGTVGGAISRNPIYKASLMIMGLPNTQQLAEIMVSVGLAQNFGALRALVIEGIQKGHMLLHARAIASMNGVPQHMIDECCKYMTKRHKYDKETVQAFLEYANKPML